MKVTVMPIIIGALGKVTKGLMQGLEDLEIRGQAETIQTTTLSRRVLETCCHSNSYKKPSANAGWKNSQKSDNNNDDNN